MVTEKLEPAEEVALLRESCRLMRRLLTDENTARLKADGMRRMASRIRAENRRAFLELLESYAAKVHALHTEEVNLLRQRHEVGAYDSLFRRDMELRFCIQRLRLAALLHQLRIGDAARMVDRSLAHIDRLLYPQKVVSLQVR